MMDIKPIHTKADHKAAFKLVSKLVDPDPARGAPDGDMREIMATSIEANGARHFPIEPAGPVDSIRLRSDQQGLGPRDLQPMIGGLNRVYEVLARSRPVTMPLAWRLRKQLGIPAESLVRRPKSA